jgi:pimeloyl-ACP methyl ester carboxylesterase
VRPETRYALSGDVHVAYQVIGDGPRDLVYVPGWFSHVEAMWDRPDISSFLSRLSSFARLIVFDKRGSGMSDPMSADSPPTLEQRMDDLRAVMDAAESERASLLAVSEGGSMSLLFAASHPERVSALVLYGTYARVAAAPGYEGLDPEVALSLLDTAMKSWGDGAGAYVTAPSRAHDEEFRRELGAYERLSASPGMVRAGVRLNLQIDVRDVLPSVRVPTLVLHRTGESFIPVTMGRYLAQHIPDAKMVELPGSDHLLIAGDTEALIGEIEEFITGARSAPEVRRVLATVAFIDVVGSTERASDLGDRQWMELLGRFQALTRSEIARFQGREVNTAGDGFLITFDGPGRAIRFAMDLCRGVKSIGLEIRTGVHTGEVELHGEDVGGIAVHIGSRVASLAGPGEVLVSSTVKDLVVGSGLEFEDQGHRELKGVPGSWALFSVR